MNLLMILLIILAIWVSAAICYFAWRLTPEVPPPPDPAEPAGEEPDSESGPRSP